MVGPADEDPLLRKAREAREQARRAREAAGDGQRQPGSGFDQTAEDMRRGAETARQSWRFLRSAAGTASAIWRDYLEPVFGFAAPPFRWLGRRYMAIFRRLAYGKDASGARTVYSKKRGAAAVIFSVFFGLFAVWHWFFVPTVWNFSLDTFYYFTSRKMEIYLHSPQRIETGEYEVSGCLRYPCEDEDAYYFRIVDNSWKDMEYLFSRGYFHHPENTAGRLTGEANKCVAEFAGSTARWGQRNLGLSTKILDLSCTPISAEQVPTK